MDFPWWYVLFNVSIWLICYFISYKHSFVNNVYYSVSTYGYKFETLFIYILFFITTEFTFYGGDIEQYRFFVEYGYQSYGTKDFDAIENYYFLLTNIANHNFYIWKVLVYLPALILTYLTTVKLECNFFITLLAFTTFCLISYGATRGVFAYSLFLFSFIFLKSDKKLYYVVAFGLIFISQYAHSSMILPIVLSPLMFVRITKNRIKILALLFPAAVLAFNILYPMLYSNADFMGEQYGYKFETYTEDGTSAGGGYYGSILTMILGVYSYIVVFMSVFYSLKADMSGLLPKAISRITRFSFFLFYIVLVVSCSSMPNSAMISTRYMMMIPFFLFVTWPFFLNEESILRIIKRKKFVLISSGYFFLKIFMYVYYGSFK